MNEGRLELVGSITGILIAVGSAAPQDRTAAALAQLSPADAYHATLFNGLGSGRRILDTLNSVKLEELPAAQSPPRSARQFLAAVACSADAVLLGTAGGGTSHPTADGEFLFTNYEFRVIEGVRMNPGLSVRPGLTLQVVRAGGQVTVGAADVRAQHLSFPPLERGKQYVLMLKHVPQFGTFVSNDSSGQFVLERGKLRPMAFVNSDDLAAGISLGTFVEHVNSVKCS